MRSAWTYEFKAANTILWEQLFQMLGKTTVWEHAKKTQRLKNGRKAYRAILLSLFGVNIVLFLSQRQKKEITALTYKGEYRNFSWAGYFNRHLTLHKPRSSLEIRAEELGRDVFPWSEYKNFIHLQNDITDGILDAGKSAIICDPNGLWSNFSKRSCHNSDFLDSTAVSNLGKNRNIYQVSGDRNSRNGNGQGRGNGSPHVARGDGGKRQIINRYPWTQAGVYAYAHITEKCHPDARYRTFNGNERQKVWQNSKCHSKDADATSSNQISVSQVTLSKISTNISTLSDQHDATNCRVDTLDDGTRSRYDVCSGRDERSDCHCDNANHEIARGDTPGRNNIRSRYELP